MSRRYSHAAALDFTPGPVAAEPRGRDRIAELYGAHAASVYRWVQRLGGPGFDVEDAVQEVFTVAQERMGTFRGESQVRTWLFGIARRVVHRQRAARFARELPGGLAEDVAGYLASADRPALDQLAAEQLQKLVYLAFDRMTPRYRDALILFELDGMSGEEIGLLQGVRASTVWVLLHRARRQFLTHLSAITGRRP